ncbi:MerR family transcriptional regulator [Nocardiopsis dassonvillei]|uniref:MerR family transcriptional regulator n=1 Tax=Nocardiopsis dassonvillei TaxID=2014 RepID=UPI00200F33C5|nr:MerR family transcriptional regulator [Nocardiopsis dassonvillei]MCK9868053.1 MerR family transcriptional regulator [Nocardiopsis dassonvillei]
MAWSTRQLAELAGTTLRTVRHYHEVGLLAEPERGANGYKRYRVEHLVRVLRVKRLSDLGFSLVQIAEMGEADAYPEQELRALDDELVQAIERLRRMREELALALRGSGPTELPPDMALATAGIAMTEADRSLAAVMARLFTPQTQRALTELARAYGSGASDEEFDNLSADADERTRQELTERLWRASRDLLSDRPELRISQATTAIDRHKAAQAFTTALNDLYNPAQLDVLNRLSRAAMADQQAEERTSQQASQQAEERTDQQADRQAEEQADQRP